MGGVTLGAVRPGHRAAPHPTAAYCVVLIHLRRSAARRRIRGHNTHSSMDVVTLAAHAALRSAATFPISTINIDMDTFIQCVQERPALWEKCTKEYSSRNCKGKSWIEIGEIMYGDWLDLESCMDEVYINIHTNVKPH